MKDLLVTGGKTGMVGNAIQSYSKDSIFVNSSDCDLRDLNATRELFNKHKPKYVIRVEVSNEIRICTYTADFRSEVTWSPPTRVGSRVSTFTKPSVALSLGATGAVDQSANTAATIELSASKLDATAP